MNGGAPEGEMAYAPCVVPGCPNVATVIPGLPPLCPAHGASAKVIGDNAIHTAGKVFSRFARWLVADKGEDILKQIDQEDGSNLAGARDQFLDAREKARAKAKGIAPADDAPVTSPSDTRGGGVLPKDAASGVVIDVTPDEPVKAAEPCRYCDGRGAVMIAGKDGAAALPSVCGGCKGSGKG